MRTLYRTPAFIYFLPIITLWEQTQENRLVGKQADFLNCCLANYNVFFLFAAGKSYCPDKFFKIFVSKDGEAAAKQGFYRFGVILRVDVLFFNIPCLDPG